MTAPSANHLRWPPPGLEPVHGKLWPLIAFLTVADVVLVLPLVVTVGTHQGFASMGPFGQQWWILLFTTALGALMLAGVAERLVRIAWLAGRAAKEGYGWRTILLVASDESRDTGFLIQGTRQFAALEPDQRRTVLTVRLAGVMASFAGALLPPVGLLLGALLGRRGLIETGGVWALTVWLPLFLLVFGGLGRFMAYLLARAGAAVVDRKEHAAGLRVEIVEWSERSRAIVPNATAVFGESGRAGAFRGGAIAGAVVAAIVIVAVVLMAMAGSVGPILMSIAVPSFSAAQGRILEAEVYRPYRLPTDPRMDATAAGEALYALTLVGSRQPPSPLMRVPVRVYDPISDSLPDVTRHDQEWMIAAFERGGRGLSPVERQRLRQAAQHPALSELATVAVAPAADIAAARYTFPLPDTLQAYALPIPRYGPLRAVTGARLMEALLDLAEGRGARAEHGIREVISTGLLLIDDGPHFIDAMIGTAIVREAGTAFEALLRGTGRGREAETLVGLRDQTRLVAGRVHVLHTGRNVEAALAAMSRAVTDTATVRGLRWEFYTSVTAFAPCANLHTMVFGPGEEYVVWAEEAHAGLVRYESEEQLFEFMGRGLFGTGGCLPVLRELRLVSSIR